jgi:CDP-diglyceride synthetase
MNEPSGEPEQPPLGQGDFWLGWILSTVVLPAIAGCFVLKSANASGLAMALLPVCLLLHLITSIYLEKRGWLVSFLLFFGGWGLMVVSFFAGCVSLGKPFQ